MEDKVLSHDALISPEEYKKLPHHPLFVVLDNLRSAFNVGSVFRTADAARIEKLLLCGTSAYPPHRKLEKTGMGTLDHVAWQHYPSVREALEELRLNNIPAMALEITKKSRSIFDFTFPKPAALIFGNEALGVSSEAQKVVDHILEIPLFGFKNSINVASAVCVTVFEVIRQWNLGLPAVKIFRKE